jgi:hypothetical protein
MSSFFKSLSTRNKPLQESEILPGPGEYKTTQAIEVESKKIQLLYKRKPPMPKPTKKREIKPSNDFEDLPPKFINGIDGPSPGPCDYTSNQTNIKFAKVKNVRIIDPK